MTLALLLTHLIGALAGATLLWLSRRLLAQRMRPPQQRADAEPQIEQLREHAAHVQTLIERLSMATQAADTFIASGEEVIEEIRSAFDAFDRNALSRAAHKLKGASANIHAEGLRDCAYALESQAPGLDQPRLKELIEQLAAEFVRAADFLKLQVQLPV